MTSIGSCSSQNDSLCGAINKRDAGTEDADDIVSELDDYFSALFEQMLLISDDRATGNLGKLAANSDINIAIDYMLQEARELELSYRLAKTKRPRQPGA
ncbi:hypothetical protein BG000_011465 [Podila horticola]|nr:hypothetical protein BG000_011465 [Podila horticola]